MNRLILLLVLVIPVVKCFSQDVEIDDPGDVVFEEREEEAYPSRALTEFYDKISYKEFKPEDISFINRLKYDYISVREINTGNKFMDIWEGTKFDKYYDSLGEICGANWNKIEDSRDTIAYRRYSECRDSIWNLRFAQKIGEVFKHSILRYDSLDDLKIMLYKDPVLEERDFGYWVAISKDNGRSWRKYYTGLVENYFYHIKPNSKIKFIKNGAFIQAEFALVRKTRPEILPVGAPEFELIKDNLVMEVDLAKLTADRDRDGLTDILEKKLFTNPRKADTDNDGIDDATDRNPRHKDIRSKYSNLFKYLLERSTMDSVFIPFNNEVEERKHEVVERARTYLIVTDDPDLLNLEGTENKYIILSTREFEQYRKHNYIPLGALGVSPRFDVDNKPGLKRIHINGSFWGHDYLLIEKADGWIIKSIGSYII